jgi:hypothetical protein
VAARAAGEWRETTHVIKGDVLRGLERFDLNLKVAQLGPSGWRIVERKQARPRRWVTVPQERDDELLER